MKSLVPYVTFVATTLAVASADVTCKSGAHVIVARASNEAAGYGILKPVADNITAKIPDSDSIPVPYPATIFGPLYVDSEPEGVGNLTKLIKEYGNACPDGKMALLGYSQGAHVIGDTLIGADYPDFRQAFPTTQGIAQKYIDQMFAIIMMGDPANIHGLPFDYGNSTRNGNFPRANTAKWSSTGLVNKTRSYCDADDLFCDHGQSLDVHVGYIPEYGPNAVQFVIDKWNALKNSAGNSTSSATSSVASGGAAATSTGRSSTAASAQSSTAGTTGTSASATSSPAAGNGTSIKPSLAYGLVAGIGLTLLSNFL